MITRPTRILIPLAAAAVAIGLAACGSTAAPPDNPTELNLRVATLPGTWNPLAPEFYPPFQAGEAIYESLLTSEPVADGDGYVSEFPAPWLAESFEVSDDGLTMTMELRHGVEFTDGTPFDAAAVVAVFDVVLDPEGPLVGFTTSEFTKAETRIEATGEYSLEFTTSLPIKDDWLGQLAGIRIPSPKALDDLESLATTPVGTGPYTIDSQVPGVSISFVRNPDYWNPEAFDFDTVTMAIYEDDIAALNALKSGQLNAAYLVDTTAFGPEAEAAGFRLNQHAGLSPALFFIDREGLVQPAIADVRVRRAINMALDREAINDAIYAGQGEVRSQPFFPGDEGYVEGGDDRYPYDLEAAKELMAEAGYANGFELTIPSVTGWTTVYEPALQQALAEIGITVTFEAVAQADYTKLFFEMWPSGEYPVASYGMNLSKTGHATWIDLFLGGFKEPEAAEIYDRFVNGTQQEADEAYAELGEYMLEQAWYAPIAMPSITVATVPEIVAKVITSDAAGVALATFVFAEE